MTLIKYKVYVYLGIKYKVFQVKKKQNKVISFSKVVKKVYIVNIYLS